jgi:hypothetical protein
MFGYVQPAAPSQVLSQLTHEAPQELQVLGQLIPHEYGQVLKSVHRHVYVSQRTPSQVQRPLSTQLLGQLAWWACAVPREGAAADVSNDSTVRSSSWRLSFLMAGSFSRGE